MPDLGTHTAAEAQVAVLLRRRRLVDATTLTPPVRRSAWQWLRRPLTIQAGLSALQADLIQRGRRNEASVQYPDFGTVVAKELGQREARRLGGRGLAASGEELRLGDLRRGHQPIEPSI